MTKINKYSLWAVRIHVKQIRDGKRPPFWKIEKRPYLRNGSSDRRLATDADTFGQTDGQSHYDSIYRASIAPRGKNHSYPSNLYFDPEIARIADGHFTGKPLRRVAVVHHRRNSLTGRQHLWRRGTWMPKPQLCMDVVAVHALKQVMYEDGAWHVSCQQQQQQQRWPVLTWLTCSPIIREP